ncbi:MAG: DUF302 domain-containing protein [Flavobacteriales bacterium]|jgi:uncharacterized protein (DUF302 family)|nr:DUF302 domain-containing protein [Flavobacteriales bacterium]MBK7941666.1 DUF302 domain-containing protein [Flavobacteriales bacterium]MBK8949309.1 DUF302 domain-containing protein [Flavobacteriales bacterium]MBK9700209.1 DUF302 domain-containing protein [Flavobacteriales bacterium]
MNTTTSYFMSRHVADTDMAALKDRITGALAKEGFGVLTEIDVRATMKKKLEKDVEPHLILGACNPHFAFEVLGIDPHISTMLPCNVTLRQLPDGSHEVAAIDPVAAMGAMGNPAIAQVAARVREALQRVIDSM